MNQFLIAVLVTLVGAYVAYLLSKSYAREKEKKRTVSEFSELLKHTLPAIKSGVEAAYLFSSDLKNHFAVLEENEIKLGYRLLPKTTKNQINFSSEALKEFTVEFRKLSDHLYGYFERMEDRKGQGSEQMITIVATKLVCLSHNELPKEKTLINFPRKSRGHFSSVQCLPHQVAEIWELGQQGGFMIFQEKRRNASTHLDKLEYMLDKLHGIW